MLPSMMTAQEFTRKRYPTTIDHGATVPNPTATPTSVPFRGSIQPASQSNGNDRVNRNGASIEYLIYTQPGIDVTHYDIITLADGDYFVNGEPERWGVGILNHTVISLSRWSG